MRGNQNRDVNLVNQWVDNHPGENGSLKKYSFHQRVKNPSGILRALHELTFIMGFKCCNTSSTELKKSFADISVQSKTTIIDNMSIYKNIHKFNIRNIMKYLSIDSFKRIMRPTWLLMTYIPWTKTKLFLSLSLSLALLDLPFEKRCLFPYWLYVQ